MKQFVKSFTSSNSDELTTEINTYLEKNNCKIITMQMTMTQSFPHTNTVLICFEENE